MPRFKNYDHNTPLLLPPDLSDWVPEDHIAHFILDAVKMVDISSFHVNHRGSGSEQYHPHLMLSLLIYCYSTGRFHSRQIEQATYSDVAVRFICCDQHPDHDTICTFRRKNSVAFKTAFLQVLLLAQELGHLKKVGTVSVDGSKFKANASKHAAVSYGRAEQMIIKLENEVSQLTTKAEQADAEPLNDGLLIPDEIKRREDRIDALKKAKIEIEKKFKVDLKVKIEKYEEKKERRDEMRRNDKKPMGIEPKPPAKDSKPDSKNQYNFTDQESQIMKQGGGHFEQSYNAQAAVDADGSMLILGGQVTNQNNDKRQLKPVVEDINPEIKKAEIVLADTGYFSEKAILELEASGKTKVLCAIEKGKHGWSVEDLEPSQEPQMPPDGCSFKELMKYRLKTKEGKEKYRLRKQTVEPVFGIIKSVMKFRTFTMRGLTKVNTEWDLIKLAYNIKKLHKMTLRITVPTLLKNS